MKGISVIHKRLPLEVYLEQGWGPDTEQLRTSSCEARKDSRDAMRREDVRRAGMVHEFADALQNGRLRFFVFQGVMEACPQAKGAQKSANAS